MVDFFYRDNLSSPEGDKDLPYHLFCRGVRLYSLFEDVTHNLGRQAPPHPPQLTRQRVYVSRWGISFLRVDRFLQRSFWWINFFLLHVVLPGTRYRETKLLNLKKKTQFTFVAFRDSARRSGGKKT